MLLSRNLLLFAKNADVRQNLVNYTYFFYKQPAYKELALKRQIAKQLLGINPFSLSNNKNYN